MAPGPAHSPHSESSASEGAEGALAQLRLADEDVANDVARASREVGDSSAAEVARGRGSLRLRARASSPPRDFVTDADAFTDGGWSDGEAEAEAARAGETRGREGCLRSGARGRDWGGGGLFEAATGEVGTPADTLHPSSRISHPAVARGEPPLPVGCASPEPARRPAPPAHSASIPRHAGYRAPARRTRTPRTAHVPAREAVARVPSIDTGALEAGASDLPASPATAAVESTRGSLSARLSAYRRGSPVPRSPLVTAMPGGSSDSAVAALRARVLRLQRLLARLARGVEQGEAGGAAVLDVVAAVEREDAALAGAAAGGPEATGAEPEVTGDGSAQAAAVARELLRRRHAAHAAMLRALQASTEVRVQLVTARWECLVRGLRIWRRRVLAQHDAFPPASSHGLNELQAAQAQAGDAQRRAAALARMHAALASHVSELAAEAVAVSPGVGTALPFGCVLAAVMALTASRAEVGLLPEAHPPAEFAALFSANVRRAQRASARSRAGRAAFAAHLWRHVAPPWSTILAAWPPVAPPLASALHRQPSSGVAHSPRQVPWQHRVRAWVLRNWSQQDEALAEPWASLGAPPAAAGGAGAGQEAAVLAMELAHCGAAASRQVGVVPEARDPRLAALEAGDVLPARCALPPRLRAAAPPAHAPSPLPRRNGAVARQRGEPLRHGLDALARWRLAPRSAPWLARRVTALAAGALAPAAQPAALFPGRHREGLSGAGVALPRQLALRRLMLRRHRRESFTLPRTACGTLRALSDRALPPLRRRCLRTHPTALVGKRVAPRMQLALRSVGHSQRYRVVHGNRRGRQQRQCMPDRLRAPPQRACIAVLGKQLLLRGQLLRGSGRRRRLASGRLGSGMTTVRCTRRLSLPRRRTKWRGHPWERTRMPHVRAPRRNRALVLAAAALHADNRRACSHRFLPACLQASATTIRGFHCVSDYPCTAYIRDVRSRYAG